MPLAAPLEPIADVADRVLTYLGEHTETAPRFSARQCLDVRRLAEFARANPLRVVGDRLRFAHQPEDRVGCRVTMVHDDGSLEIDRLPGQYAPHLFVRLELDAIEIPPTGKTLRAIEHEAVAITLRHTADNQTAAARLLGTSRVTLARKRAKVRRG